MAFNLNTFLTRLGSAVVFCAIVLGVLLWNEWAFIVLFLVVNFLCLREYATILEKVLQVQFTRNEKANYVGLGIATYLVVISLAHIPCSNLVIDVLRTQHFYFAGLTIGFLILFFLFKKNKKAIYLLTGITYISLALGLLVHLRFQSLVLPVMLIFFIWMNDTMAYLTGSFLGRTPFFPKISPKKTLEGTIGGIVFAMAFATIWGSLTDWFPLWQWVLMGAIASIAGTAGDLIESKLKRMAGVKDSGNLMPGHGGALDRFDSLLFAAPFAYLLAVIAMSCLSINVF